MFLNKIIYFINHDQNCEMHQLSTSLLAIISIKLRTEHSYQLACHWKQAIHLRKSSSMGI